MRTSTRPLWAPELRQDITLHDVSSLYLASMPCMPACLFSELQGTCFREAVATAEEARLMADSRSLSPAMMPGGTFWQLAVSAVLTRLYKHSLPCLTVG